MVNVLVIETGDEYGIVDEIVGFLSSRVQCRVTNLSVPPDVLSFPGLVIHTKEQTVYHNGTLVPMTYREFFTLLYLAQHPGWVFSKEQIYNAVWKESGDGGAAVVSVISQIRHKLGDDYIETVIGSGYKFIG